ncbi:uncharacterized protein LOC132702354 [Cylas formicarius]|uniref:uncharacterized protein LOC132702354 n=1 Tax=Cylas formicarius TaxID=197179 RepID=UPI002958465E|nr:uncharacterized protein LOC132702354 [Cylas formicarius]
MKNTKILGGDKIDCCSYGGKLLESGPIPDDSGANAPFDAAKEIMYLKELLKQKDLVIENQAIAITALKEQLSLLKSSRLFEEQTLDSANRAKSSQTDPIKQNAPKSEHLNKFTNKELSSAVSEAVSRQICSEIIELDAITLNEHFELLNEKISFHITKLHPNTKVEEVQQYLAPIVSGVEVFQVPSMYPESYSSFRVLAMDHEAQKILDTSIWPTVSTERQTSSEAESRPKTNDGEFVSRVVQGYDDGEISKALLYDLTKAFDCVDYVVLLNKLEFYGVRGNPLQLIQSYLDSRFQYVESGGVSSDSVLPVVSGVPQCSVLGPLLFIIYINDLPLSIPNANVTQFADDTAVLSKARNHKMLTENVDETINLLTSYYVIQLRRHQ